MILQVGKVIRQLLTENKNVTNLVEKKIYPLIADIDTTFPFIVYRRSGISLLTSKDKIINKQECMVELVIASVTYENSVKIASNVIDALLHKKGNIAGINVLDVELTDASEDYVEETFIQSLTFKISITK